MWACHKDYVVETKIVSLCTVDMLMNGGDIPVDRDDNTGFREEDIHYRLRDKPMIIFMLLQKILQRSYKHTRNK